MVLLHMISPLFVVVPPPRFFQLADCNSGPAQPSLRTTAEERNHLVSQAPLALRKKTRSPVLSHRGDYIPLTLHIVLSGTHLEFALSFSQNFCGVLTLGKGRLLEAVTV